MYMWNVYRVQAHVQYKYMQWILIFGSTYFYSQIHFKEVYKYITKDNISYFNLGNR